MSIIAKCAAAAVAISGVGTAALAGPYANVEANSGFVGSNYSATVTDIHLGYEDSISESASFYVQAGPAIVAVDGADTETEFSGKVGLGVDVSDSLNVYGEVSFLTNGEEDNNYGTKAGVKWSF